MGGSITIRDLDGGEALAAAEDLQDTVWAFDPRGIVPAHVLHVAAHHGGIVLGAYHGSDLVGFCVGFLGRHEGAVCHVSHLLAVHPNWRGQGIGVALKRAQRDRAVGQGLDLMIWTFDPLQRRNAHLNLHVLGAQARRYHVNLYGPLNDSLNAGLPTDRLIAEWHLCRAPIRTETPPRTLLSLDLVLAPDALAAPAVSIAIPDDIVHLKAEDPETALRWRLAQRDAFGTALDAGFVVRDSVQGMHVLVKEGA